MATVSKPTFVPTPAVGMQRTAAKVKPKIMLPTEPFTPVHDFNEYNGFIHGVPKIGKTSLCTVEEGVLLLTCDPLQKSLAVMQLHMPSWEHVQEIAGQLEQLATSGNYPYKRTVIDGGSILHRHCQTYVEQTLGISHPSEGKWGRGWDGLNGDFAKMIDRFMALPGGCWFIAHSKWKEIKTRNANEAAEKLTPDLKPGAENQLVGKPDFIFAYDFSGKERVLVIRGDERTQAGCRIKGHFLTPDGREIVEVPMGRSEYEGWDNLLKAFHNEQKFTHVSAAPAPRTVAPVKPGRSSNGNVSQQAYEPTENPKGGKAKVQFRKR